MHTKKSGYCDNDSTLNLVHTSVGNHTGVSGGGGGGGNYTIISGILH